MLEPSTAWADKNQLVHYRGMLALVLAANIVSFLTVETRISDAPGLVPLFTLSTVGALGCFLASAFVPSKVSETGFDRLMMAQLYVLAVYFGFQTAVTNVNTMETVDAVMLSLIAPIVMPRHWMLLSWLAVNPLIAYLSVRFLNNPHLPLWDYLSLIGFGSAIGVVARFRLLYIKAERDRAAAVLEAVFQRSRDGLLVLERERTNVVQMNPRMFELFGNSDQDSMVRLVTQQFGAGEVINEDRRLQISENQSIEVRVNSVSLESFGRALQLIQIADVSDLYSRQHKLQQEKISAEAAVEVRSQFLANMSHEIRTPMNGVIGIASLLKRTPLNKEQQELVNTIGTSGETLLAIINDILDFSKSEAGQVELEVRPLRVEQCVKDALDIIRPLVHEKNINLQLNLPEANLPEYMGDAVRLRQVLLNLLSNAVKFTQAGTVTVTLTQDDSGELTLQVMDTGIGIQQENLKNLFEAFTQADASTNRQFGGTGLGLSISKSLIELMGGRIWVESTFGEGSVFGFTLNLSRSNNSGRAIAITTPNAKIQKLEWPRDARVLVAEDNAVNQAVARKILARLGITCDLAENGEQALSLAKETEYAVILMDMQMPVMDGLETTRQLRAHGHTGHIVAMTANALVEDRQRCLAAGMDSFLSKPVRLEDLQQHLANAIDKGHISFLAEVSPTH